MHRTVLLFLTLGLLLMAAAEHTALAEPAAAWAFDEGTGTVVRDRSGNGHDAMLHGADWDDTGTAVTLRGPGRYVDCGATDDWGITGPVSVEAWVKPMVKGHGEAHLLGIGMSHFTFTYYNAELCYWYIGSGGNNLRGKLTLGEWNHIVGTFDGTTMSMWLNGRLMGSQESKIKTYPHGGPFVIGSNSNNSNAPLYEGLIDNVRVYNRAISAAEVVGHFKAEAGNYGFDPTWFSRIKVTPYYYFDRNELVLDVDCRGLQPLAGTGRLEVSLQGGDAVNVEVPEEGIAEVRLPIGVLADGTHELRVSLRDDDQRFPVETITFEYPPPVPIVPATTARSVGPIPAPTAVTPYDLSVGKNGGFTITVRDRKYAFQTRVSWPNGDFNVLGGAGGGEEGWSVESQSTGVHASGASYAIDRNIDVRPTHVYIKDTYTNTTDADLGLLIYNELVTEPEQIKRSLLGGFEGRRRVSSTGSAEIFSPSVFVTDEHTSFGMLPVDDVFVVQCLLYSDENAGMGTEYFALGPGKSYTLEWAVYPTDSNDYYDFINSFRQAEGRIARVDGGLGFTTFGPMNRRQVPDAAFIKNRNIKYALVHCLSRSADDPEVSIEGIEFMDFPKEMRLLRGQSAAYHRKHPGVKIMFHIAHSLYMTNNAERFPDSKVILANGLQAEWEASEPYVSKRRQDEGWTWYVYYPTPGNSFHDAMLKSVDVMMDDLGFDGAFMDGFLAAYRGYWTYDGRWDGHSAEIDKTTKTINRKMASVILMSQPSLIEYTRKIHDKGGVVVANNTMMTRSITREKYIIFDQEVAAGPHLHLGPSVTALAQPPFFTEMDIYLDTLEKLSWGELFVYYQDRIKLSGPSLASKQFPITFEEIRSGLVRGKERIVTMNSGVYGWPGDDRLHLVYRFDARGTLVPNGDITTVDRDGIRTQLTFGKHESAVIEPIPANLSADSAVNVVVRHYDADRLDAIFNGSGAASLELVVGTSYPDRRDGVLTNGGMNPAVVGVGNPYRITIGSVATTIEERDGLLTVPLELDGQVAVSIRRQ